MELILLWFICMAVAGVLVASKRTILSANILQISLVGKCFRWVIGWHLNTNTQSPLKIATELSNGYGKMQNHSISTLKKFQ